MPLISDIAWPDLSLEALSSFLAEAGDEGLTWEAKGTTPTPHAADAEFPKAAALAKAACGFANSVGGDLIIGASREQGDAWGVVGARFPDEPEVWLDQILRDLLRPTPDLRIGSWILGDGRTVAVVRVAPVPAPPCLSGGRAYLRVSGRTVPVIDPGVLTDLTTRGREAERRAHETADVLAQGLLDDPLGIAQIGDFRVITPEYALCALALAPTGLPDDIDTRPFTPDAWPRLRDAVNSVLTPWSLGAPDPSLNVTQDGTTAAVYDSRPGDDRSLGYCMWEHRTV